MSQPMPYDTPHHQLRVDAGRLWSGGAATALVAVGVTVVSLLGLRAVLDIPALAPWADRVSVGYDLMSAGIAAALAAVAATGLLHLLMYSTPRAHQFFGWIAALVVAGLILRVFVGGLTLPDQLVLSALYLLVGIAITSLLRGVGSTAMRYEEREQSHRGYRYDRYDDEAYRGYRYDEGTVDDGYGDRTLRLYPSRNRYRP